MQVNRITKKDGKLETTQVEVPTPVYNFRVRPEIYEPLVLEAAKESRSITAHINHILGQHLTNQLK